MKNLKSKNILVTGGSGFIGSHLVKRLLDNGANVSVTVKYKSINDNIRLSPCWNDIEVYEVELKNIDSLRQFQKSHFDVVYHLAAYNHVGDSFLHHNESLLSNGVATANLLEHGPTYDRFLYMSSSEVYGFQDSVPFEESATPFPISPYSIGKYTGELYARMKRKENNLPIVCVRAFNTFGPYQSERAIIPELIVKCLRGDTIKTTEGKQTREFNFVENIVEGLIAAVAKDPAVEGVINIGAKEEVSIKDLITKIHTMCNSDSKLEIGALPYRPTEIWRMYSSNDRARNLLSWEPRISFDKGLQLTIDWFRKYLEVFYNSESSLNGL